MITANLQRFLITLIAIVVCLPLTNCSSEDNDEAEILSNKEYVRAYYRIDLDQAWYDLYDIEVIYTDVTGATNIINNTLKNSVYEATILKDKACKTLSFSVVAKPKANAPEIDDSAIYSLNHNCVMYVYQYSKGSEDAQPVHKSGCSVTMSSGGNALRAQLTKEHTIISSTYAVK